MNKRFAIIFLMLAAVVGMYAQDLKGSWKTQTVKDSLDIDILFTFTESALDMKFLISHEDPELGLVVMSINLPSLYKRTDDLIKIDYDANQFKLKIEKIEFSDEVKKTMDDEPGMADFFRGLIEVAINSGKDKLIETFKKSDELRIDSLTTTSLVLTDETGESMSFTRSVEE